MSEFAVMMDPETGEVGCPDIQSASPVSIMAKTIVEDIPNEYWVTSQVDDLKPMKGSFEDFKALRDAQLNNEAIPIDHFEEVEY